MRSSRQAHINEFVAAASHEGELTDAIHHDAVLVIRRIKSRNDKDDAAVWAELREELDGRGYDVDWMTDHQPNDTTH
ncbi:hypothetical protein [Halococcus sp. PRR34]|uniref:hypothetical protein n=1 Tax=Halococcus sp. PRR34 TaxID=3020830 RepID=UPI00235DC881|nr:hypothetical protein [Halococcus sp. PRR34]